MSEAKSNSISAPVEIDGEDLIMAFENAEGEMTWFIDLETGEVGNFWDGMLNGETQGEDFDIDEFLEADRYHQISSGFGSHDSYKVMEDFIDDLPDGRSKEKLTQAITGRKPFRNFKDTLFDCGEVRDQWFKFKDERDIQRVKEWVELEGFNAIVVDKRAV